MPADRWFGVGCCGGTQELAGARAVDDALIHDGGFRNQALVVLSIG